MLSHLRDQPVNSFVYEPITLEEGGEHELRVIAEWPRPVGA